MSSAEHISETLDAGISEAIADAIRARTEIKKQYAAAKIQAIHVMNYNGAMLSYNHQSDMANKLGLDERQKLDVTPFPMGTKIINVNVKDDKDGQNETPNSPTDSPQDANSESQQGNAQQPLPPAARPDDGGSGAQPQPQSQASQQPKRSPLKKAAAAALVATGVGAAGLAGYVIGNGGSGDRPTPPAEAADHFNAGVGLEVEGLP